MSFGEIGLAGEIRPVKFGAERIAEAAKQGFEVAVVPEMNMPQQKNTKIKLVGVRKLDEALRETFA
jgi:DNA repair protein RadA/Sms